MPNISAKSGPFCCREGSCLGRRPPGKTIHNPLFGSTPPRPYARTSTTTQSISQSDRPLPLGRRHGLPKTIRTCPCTGNLLFLPSINFRASHLGRTTIHSPSKTERHSHSPQRPPTITTTAAAAYRSQIDVHGVDPVLDTRHCLLGASPSHPALPQPPSSWTLPEPPCSRING